MRSLEARLAAASELADPIRRSIYLHLQAATSPVSRDEVAAALGLTRRAGTFHLERLLDAGLLRASYARPPGRSGPGAGRPAKRYEPAVAELDVQVPPRRYDLVARMLLASIEGRPDAAEAATHEAAARGRALGGHVPHNADPIRVAEAVLARHGYEPERNDGTLRPTNCPFKGLGDVACSLNHAFLDAFAGELGLLARRANGPCCVELRIAE